MVRSRRYPGAHWAPAGTHRGAMAEVRGISLHEAVTRAASIRGWVDQTDACHLYVAEDGTAEQYKEVGEIAYGVADGNSTMLTVETWDGLTPATERDVHGRGPNETVWTPAQCERIADFIAWAHHEWGVPIRLMASSKRSERGVAPHRWGVDPWRRPDGEIWTKHRGKQCPGDRRIAQIPSILDRALDLAGVEGYRPIPPGRITSTPPATLTAAGRPDEDDMPLTDQDHERIFATVLAANHRAARELGYEWSGDAGRLAQAVVDRLAGGLVAAITKELSDVPAERIEAAVKAGIGSAFAAAGEAAGNQR